MNGRFLDQVIVVNDEHHGSPVSANALISAVTGVLNRARGRVAELRGDVLGEPRPADVERSGDVPPEPTRVVVVLVQR